MSRTLDEASVRVAVDDELRVQHALGRAAARIEFGAQRVDEVRRRRAVTMSIAVVSASRSSTRSSVWAGARTAPKSRLRAARSASQSSSVPGSWLRGVREEAALEDVGVDGRVWLRLVTVSGHLGRALPTLLVTSL